MILTDLVKTVKFVVDKIFLNKKMHIIIIFAIDENISIFIRQNKIMIV